MKADTEESATDAFIAHDFKLSHPPHLSVTETAEREFALEGRMEGDPTVKLNDWYAESNNIDPPYPNGTLLLWTMQELGEITASSPRV